MIITFNILGRIKKILYLFKLFILKSFKNATDFDGFELCKKLTRYVNEIN